MYSGRFRARIAACFPPLFRAMLKGGEYRTHCRIPSMKTYRDHYFLKAKRQNYPARSVYKLK
jgi:hypothetical protein